MAGRVSPTDLPPPPVMTTTPPDVSRRGRSSPMACTTLLDRERLLWALAATTLVLDVVLTATGRRLGLTEANPLVALLLARFGIGSLAALKVGAVGAAVCCRRLVPERYLASIPLGLGLAWGVAVVANLVAISVVVVGTNAVVI